MPEGRVPADLAGTGEADRAEVDLTQRLDKNLGDDLTPPVLNTLRKLVEGAGPPTTGAASGV